MLVEEVSSSSIPKEEEEEGEETNVDEMEELLTTVGLGRWQIPLLLSACFIQMGTSLNKVGTPLYDAPLPFVCSSPLHQDHYFTSNISYENECLSEVEMPELYSGKGKGPPSCPVVHYETSVFDSTFTSRWNLVCEWEPYRPWFLASLSIGNLVGSVIGGYLSDSFGRRFSIMVGAALGLPACLAMAVAPSFAIVIIARFTIGIVELLTLLPVYALVMESCPNKSRAVISNTTAIFFSLAIIALGIVAHWVRDFQYLLYFISFPWVVLIVFAILMDESPRWLVQQGRGHQATQLLTKAATLNKTTIPPHLLKHLYKCNTKSGSAAGLKSESESESSGWWWREMWWSFKREARECAASTVLCRILVAASVLSFCNRLLFLGIPLNTNNVASTEPQTYVLYIGISDFVSTLVAVFLSHTAPRRLCIGSFHMLASLFLMLDLLFPTEWRWLHWMLTLTSYCLMGCVFELTMVYYVELMPTVVRSRGVTIIDFLGCLGEFCVPFITHLLAPRVSWSVDVIFMVMGVIGGLMILLLPETSSLPLTDTIADVEERERRANSDSGGGGYWTRYGDYSYHSIQEERANKTERTTITMPRAE
ncbi:hypothetical protein Pmani_023725 [Petrolisthes manimaculis]|uniref:Major facilitator superfamily (MFS) profile domain-containing protein n=1 Tax=Petrolisthes manimaculis TaxID=1843537 RepID=A0AAE1TZD1_9EUCA|nr:hypothetical protein Pmani_023725 [Petrolisthes manimaculis]